MRSVPGVVSDRRAWSVIAGRARRGGGGCRTRPYGVDIDLSKVFEIWIGLAGAGRIRRLARGHPRGLDQIESLGLTGVDARTLGLEDATCAGIDGC
ncbi:hypothetical protein GCM10023322_38840 [Rugosimonospora acidiphila]|uniref:Uncharacterized protein n=1 Tax=Rugosimonospora acidiphila TaxID=556531 RepID=A0ABP9RW63_9ACTN